VEEMNPNKNFSFNFLTSRAGCPEEILENIKERKNWKCNYKTTNWTKGNNYRRN
jgi:hypothetical protein